jgi:uncharacterized protein with HEPN domain
MASRDPALYLMHIRDCCVKISECVSLLQMGSTPPHILLDAACRNLEILGEASRKLGSEFRAQHPALPWREMNDLRNVLIHNYDGADPAMVWGIANRQIPELYEQIVQLIEQLAIEG